MCASDSSRESGLAYARCGSNWNPTYWHILVPLGPSVGLACAPQFSWERLPAAADHDLIRRGAALAGRRRGAMPCVGGNRLISFRLVAHHRGSRRDATGRAERYRSPMAHVLVIDDSPTVRLTLHSWLEPAGHQVAEAADGIAALAQLAALSGPLVVLLDYQMPGLTGFEVLQQALAERRGPPDYGFVVISGRQVTSHLRSPSCSAGSPSRSCPSPSMPRHCSPSSTSSRGGWKPPPRCARPPGRIPAPAREAPPSHGRACFTCPTPSRCPTHRVAPGRAPGGQVDRADRGPSSRAWAAPLPGSLRSFGSPWGHEQHQASRTLRQAATAGSSCAV
jgi:CheY-like chemotaxis protein